MKITCTFSAALLLAPLAALHSADAKEPGGAGNRIATAKQAMEKATALMRPISTKADSATSKHWPNI